MYAFIYMFLCLVLMFMALFWGFESICRIAPHFAKVRRKKENETWMCPTTVNATCRPLLWLISWVLCLFIISWKFTLTHLKPFYVFLKPIEC